MDQFLTLGQPAWGGTWLDYVELGIGPEHVAELGHLLGEEGRAGDAEGPETWAAVHAWRALAQLGALEVVVPMLESIDGSRGRLGPQRRPLGVRGRRC